MKKILAIFVILGLMTVTIAACSISSTPATGPNQVHMGDVSFLKQSITISKGQPITLVNDSTSVHIIDNGTWNNGMQVAKREPGAPAINDVQVAGSGSASIGPFNTAGTFLIYCSIHNDMKMTVIVK